VVPTDVHVDPPSPDVNVPAGPTLTMREPLEETHVAADRYGVSRPVSAAIHVTPPSLVTAIWAPRAAGFV
jgi:hypothetical protein